MSIASPSARPLPTFVSKVFPNAAWLGEYLLTARLAEEVNKRLIEEARHYAILSILLTQIIVIPRAEWQVHNYQCNGSLSTLLQHCLAIHLKQARLSPQRTNVLCLRQRAQRKQDGFLGLSGHATKYQDPLDCLPIPEAWQRLLRVIGNEAVTFLLLDCILLQSLVDGFVQVAGEPLGEMMLGREGSGQWTSPQPLQHHLQRHRIFYGGAILTGEGEHLIGLRFAHPLNKCKSTLPSRVDQLICKLFYRLLPPPTKSARKSSRWAKLHAFTLGLVKAHQKCPYRHLYDYYCPDVDTRLVGDQEQFHSQDDQVNIASPPNRKETYPSKRRRLINSSNDHTLWSLQIRACRVAAFLQAILDRLLFKGRSHLGDLRRTLFKKIHLLVRLRRYETLTLAEVMKGVKGRDLVHLLFFPPEPIHKDTHHPLSTIDMLHCQSLIFWLFEEFLIPLVRNNFYCTETAPHRNQVSYFRHDAWERVTFPVWQKLKQDLFLPVDPSQSRASGLHASSRARIRLLPKEQGFRPVIKLHSPSPSLHGIRATSKGLLKNLHAILNYHRIREPHLLGASIIGMDEAYERLVRYKGHLQGLSSHHKGKLFIVKFDAQACFDSIPHERLMQVLGETINQEDYLVQRYDLLLAAAGGKLKGRFKRVACPVTEARSILSLAQNGSLPIRNALLIDKAVSQQIDQDKALRMLEEHITQNRIRIGQDFFHQRVGIPQGSILSTLLCSFFYGHLDRAHLSVFLNDRNSLMMRFVDDILFISPSLHLASQFIKVLSGGFPEYGFSINQQKGLANFDHPGILHVLQDDSLFPWCGLLLDTRTLTVRADYTKFYSFHIRESLTIDRTLPAISTLMHYLRIYLRPKLHPLFLSDQLNEDWLVVATNIYQNFVHVSIKMHVYLKELEGSGLALLRDNVLWRIVQDLALYTQRLISKRSAHPLIQAASLTRALFYRAFLETWHLRPTRYRALLPVLLSKVHEWPLETSYALDSVHSILAAGEELHSKILF